jgi:CRISPR-associated exonuclease Cas4
MTIVPISALEHFSYCRRQCALIHVEGCFIDNLWTARGTSAHQRVDAAVPWRGGRVVRAMSLYSDRLGLTGRADIVVLADDAPPYPVEHKSGALRSWEHELIQLCAQALCLEEMFGQEVPSGAVYYTASRRRRDVIIDQALREKTLQVIEGTRNLIDSGEVPLERVEPRCRRCSLRPACLPEVISRPRAVGWHERALRATGG